MQMNSFFHIISLLKAEEITDVQTRAPLDWLDEASRASVQKQISLL